MGYSTIFQLFYFFETGLTKTTHGKVSSLTKLHRQNYQLKSISNQKQSLQKKLLIQVGLSYSQLSFLDLIFLKFISSFAIKKQMSMMNIKGKIKKSAQNEVDHPLDYISPWKPVNTSRQVMSMITRQRLFEELVSPLQKVGPKHNQSTATSFFQTGRKNVRSLNLSRINGSLERKFAVLKLGSIQKRRNFIGNKRVETEKEHNEVIFIKKCLPARTIHIATLGNSFDGYEAHQQTISKQSTKLNTEAQFLEYNQPQQENKKNGSIKHKKSSIHNLRTTYKKISHNTLKSLKKRNNHEPINHILGRTLYNFINHQNQI